MQVNTIKVSVIILAAHATITKILALKDTMTAVQRDPVLCQPTNLAATDKQYYYLFKKFLVSDWLTANCEIVISTQWLTKYGFFAFILAK